MSNPEIELYIEELAALRTEMLEFCDGLGEEALNWKPPVTDTNSLYQLITHVTGSDAFWLLHIVGGIPVQRDRAAEFMAGGPPELDTRPDRVKRRALERGLA